MMFSLPDKMVRFDRVVAEMIMRTGLEREGEGDGVIFGTDAVILHPEGQGARPAP